MIDYDPFSEQVRNDPYPIYRRLRNEAPACFIPKYDAWALSRFQDIWDYSSHTALSTASGTTPSQLLTKVQPVTPMLNLMDPPDHTKLRGKVRPFFAPRAIKALEPKMREIVTACLDEVLPKGRCDVIGDLAARLSVKVACMATGIPTEDGELLNRLVWRFFGREPGVDGMTQDGLAAAVELGEYFVKLVESRRKSANDDDDIVNMLRHFELDGRLFTDEEISSHLSMLIIGGSETFPKTFANAIHRLGEYPDQRAECAADPGMIPEAFNEALRYDMPTQFLGRTLLEDVEIHGEKLRTGRPVLFIYPSANRDDCEFENPDVFDIRRRPQRILSFGAGTHACIGLHVAKMEAKVCLEEVLSRIPDYQLGLDGAERLRTEFVQGFASLPISFEPL